MKKTVLVTGATGFVGKQLLIPLLEKGYQVHATTSRTISSPTRHVTWHSVDLMNQAQVHHFLSLIQPQYLLHSAWYTQHGLFWNAPENLDWVGASLNLIKAFAINGGQRAVFVGSCAEYDWNRQDTQPWRETDPCKPHTLYGASKLALLQVLQKYAETIGMSYSWARLFMLFGPDEPSQKLIASICAALHHNQTVRCSSGEKTLDLLDVRDAGRLLVELLDSQGMGVFNVASGQPTTIGQLAEMLAQISGKPGLIQLGALPDKDNEPRHIVADISRREGLFKVSLPSMAQRLQEAYESHVGLSS